MEVLGSSGQGLMRVWSTENLRPHERFDGWVALRNARRAGGHAELGREPRARFHATYSHCTVGEAGVSQMCSSTYRFERSAADIARTPLDRLIIVQQLGEGCLVGRNDGDVRLVPGGGFSTHYANVPYVLKPPREQSGFHNNVVSIPFARCRPFLARGCELEIRPIALEPAVSALFATYFRSFIAQAPHLTGAAADVAVDTLLQLALVARGLIAGEAEPARDALHAGQLEAARQFIARNLARADLTPAHAAQALGISVRQLHHLFEPTGTTFARTLLAQRLERARRLLALRPDRAVIDIALACGIESQTVFYRAFREAFAMTPTDYRREVSRGES